MTMQFEVGKTYSTRSMCDWDTVFSFEVLARTPKTMTLKMHGEKVQKRGIYVYDDVERCCPKGQYSMCPIIRADREGAERA
jgi:hypothetical protein